MIKIYQATLIKQESCKKLYDKRSPFWQETKILLKSLTFFFVMIIIFASRTQVQFSRSVVLLAWNKKLLIIGVHKTTLKILKNIKNNRTMGYDVIGFLDDDPLKTGKTFSNNILFINFLRFRLSFLFFLEKLTSKNKFVSVISLV